VLNTVVHCTWQALGLSRQPAVRACILPALQYRLFSDKVLAPNMPVETVAYAQFNYNLQTASHLSFMHEK